MNTQHKYSLAKKGKSECPNCHKKTFVLYVDTDTGERVHSQVGKCDRADNCGHHYTPKQFFADNPNLTQFAPSVQNFSNRNRRDSGTIRIEPKPSCIDKPILDRSLTAYDRNNLIQFLIDEVGAEKAGEVVGRYFVGTTRTGGTIFWQIDSTGKIRTGKVIEYQANGKRNKTATAPPVQWVHKLLKLPEYNLKQCIFGEHLLTDTSKPVAIVESEKTAIIASVYLPKYTWLAVGGSEGLNVEKLSVLRGRNVILYPDVGMFDKWQRKADELKAFCKVSVSDLLERNATDEERKAGLDLADYLLRCDIVETTSEMPKHIEPERTPQPLPIFDPSTGWYSYNDIYRTEKTTIGTIDVEDEVKELKAFFDTTPLPTTPVQLNSWATINDCAKFVDGSLSMLGSPTPKTFLPYLQRLQRLRDILKLKQAA